MEKVAAALWAHLWKEQLRAHNYEPPGPPCHRCDENHPTASCPTFSQPRDPELGSWYECSTPDACLAGVVQDIMYVRAKGGSRMRILSCSDTLTGTGSGNHFFTVAYRIAKR